MKQPNEEEKQKLLSFAKVVVELAKEWEVDCVLAVGSLDSATLRYMGKASAQCSTINSRSYLVKLADIHYQEELLASSTVEDD